MRRFHMLSSSPGFIRKDEGVRTKDMGCYSEGHPPLRTYEKQIIQLYRLSTRDELDKALDVLEEGTSCQMS